MMKTMQVLAEYAMYIVQGEMLMHGGDAYWGVDLCLEPELDSYYGQPRGASYQQQKNLTTELLTPKDGNSSVLVDITNRSHRVNSIILLGPCFTVVCTIKTGDQC